MLKFDKKSNVQQLFMKPHRSPNEDVTLSFPYPVKMSISRYFIPFHVLPPSNTRPNHPKEQSKKH